MIKQNKDLGEQGYHSFTDCLIMATPKRSLTPSTLVCDFSDLYSPLNQSSAPRQSFMTLIETPAQIIIKSDYLDQPDQGAISVFKLLLWTQEESDMKERDEESQSHRDKFWQEGSSLHSQDSILDQGSEVLFGKFSNTMEKSQKIPLLQNCDQKQSFKICQKKNQAGSKKTCNCKKTQCLKLYCDCFRENRKCDGCSCVCCHNSAEHHQERSNAMVLHKDRNPEAFKPKIEEVSKTHSKGCNCKKSGCLKKYCECYQAGLKCGDNCKCDGCKNCTGEAHKGDHSRRVLPINYKFKRDKGPNIIVPIEKEVNI